MKNCMVAGLLLLCACESSQPTASTPLRQPALAEKRYTEALEILEAGDLDAAETALRAVVEADPFHGPGHSNLGALLFTKGEHFDAAWHMRYACKLMPRASQPRANLGLLFASNGRFDSAEDHLRNALALSPGDLVITGHLARLHVKTGQVTSETITWLGRLAAEDPSPAWRQWAGEQLTRLDERTD